MRNSFFRKATKAIPWFEALSWEIPLTRQRSKSFDQDDAPFHFPFDNETWANVVESLAFSPQQTRIIERILCGMCDKQIAQDLGLSLATVRTHLSRIFDRLEVDDRVQLVLRIFSEAR